MTPHSDSVFTDNEVILGRLLDEVTERAARGETIDLEAFLREHAAHTAGLQELLPALQALCRLGRTPSAASGISSAAYEAAAAWTLPSGTLGDFRLLQELGRGGMGVVYAAEQISLDRPVAVKVLPLAALLSETQMQRFKNEARAAAMLHHPHIVGVHTVGCERGIHFYAMELVRGRTLAEVIRELRPAQVASGAQPTPAASPTSAETRAQAASSTFRGRPKLEHARYVARLGQQAAEALEYAHQQGIVHRDIKPSNLMVDDQGRLRITDFGLAHMTGGHDLTMTGDVVGTLRYMSPEQAAGRPVVDPRIDVYSLGITLYELLTQRPAFEAVDRRHLLRDVLEASPPRPRQLDPSIPADLETIVLKAVAKEPADRYATARELGEDLGRFLEHKPIRARPLGRLARGWRWCQRNPAIAALASAVVCLAVLVSVASPWIAFRQSSLAKGYRRQLDVADLNVAYQEWNSGNVGMVQPILERHPLAQSKDTAASFPWRHLSWEYERSQATIVGRHDGGATAVAATPSGSLVASGGRDGLIVFTDLETRKTVRRWRAHELGVESLAFGPDGSWLASSGGDRMVKIWNVQHETKLLKNLPCGALAKAVAVSPDGRRVVAGTDGGQLLAWSTAGEPLWTKTVDAFPVNDAEFSPDGARVAVVGEGNNVQVFRADTGEFERGFEDLKLNAFTVAFLREGNELLASTADGARIWDVRSGQALPGFQHWMKSAPAMAVSNSGLLATGGHDRVVQLWDTYTGRRLAKFASHHDLVSGVAFTSDGHQVVSSSLDGTVRAFPVREALELRERWAKVSFEWPTSLALSPRGDALVSTTFPVQPKDPSQAAGELAFWDVASGLPTATLSVPLRDAYHVALSPDGQRLATCGLGGVRLWDVATKRSMASLADDPGQCLMCVAFSPDGRWLVAGGRDAPRQAGANGLLLAWDLSQQPPKRIELSLDPPQWQVNFVLFAADSRRLAVAGDARWHDGGVDLWTLEADAWSRTQRDFIRLGSRPTWLTFIPGSDRLVANSWEGLTVVQDLAATQPALSFHGHSKDIYSSAVSADGRLLATGAYPEIKLWDTDTGDQLGVLETTMWVSCLAFTPDGRTLIWGGGDGSVHFERTGE